ncbi:hypothetical protein BKA81DRAFT_377419 [Phyllosticta paracitricarpa]
MYHEMSGMQGNMKSVNVLAAAAPGTSRALAPQAKRMMGRRDHSTARRNRRSGQPAELAPSAASNGHVHPISAPHIASHGDGMLKREASRIVSCLCCLSSAGCWSSWPVQGQVFGGASGWKRDQRYRQPLVGNMFWLLLSISTLDAAADRVAAFPPDKLLRVVSSSKE